MGNVRLSRTNWAGLYTALQNGFKMRYKNAASATKALRKDWLQQSQILAAKRCHKQPLNSDKKRFGSGMEITISSAAAAGWLQMGFKN